jgi:hypothetical protein
MANEFVVRKGLISLGGITVPHRTLSGDYTLTADDCAVELDNGGFMVTLPDLESIDGKIYIIKNSSNSDIYLETV